MLYDQYFIDDLKDRADLMRRALMVMACVVCFALAAVGQDIPKPVLVDEFPLLVNCGVLLARMDALVAERKSIPESRVATVIEAPSIDTRQVLGIRKVVSSTLQLRGLETKEFSMYFVPAEVSGVRSWLIPPGGSPPVSEEFLLVEKLPDISKPFIFGGEDEFGDCPTFVPKAFANLLLENDGSRGHIVIHEGSDPMINKFYFAERWINELVNKQGIPRNRLRLFFTKGDEVMNAEFWFVPARH